jgi:hypothetical protein
MKKIYHTILWLVLPFLAIACSPQEYAEIDSSALPSISDVEDAISVTVDQETNMVTFSMDKVGCNPYWIFSDGDYSTVNGVEKLFAKEGDYTVEVKVGNRNGLSDGSVIKSFHINATLVDETLVTALCGGLANNTKEWVWNSKVDAHFGCGPAYGADGYDLSTYGLYWWSCSKNGKSDVGMYDDSFTFGSEGSYAYNPGDGGTVFVNAGVTISSLVSYSTNDGNDYPATVSAQNTTWELSYEGDDLYITFPAGTFLGYVPNDYIYNTPKFKVLSITENKMVLVADNGSIAWRYVFIPKSVFDSEEDTETFDEGIDLTAGNYATGIVGTWTWESSTAGHFGCGPSVDDPLSWWSCAANGKEGLGLYDDELTFSALGAYTFDPGTGGTVFVNTGCTFGTNPADGNDYQVAVDSQTSNYALTQDQESYYLSFPANTLTSYMPSDAFYASPKFKITRMTTTLLEMVTVQDDISWKYRLKKVN